MTTASDEFRELMRDKVQRDRHPEDDTDGRSFLNLSDDEDDWAAPSRHPGFDPDTEAPRQSMSSVRNIIPLRRYEANTGPKGVISDAQDFRDSRRIQRLSTRSLVSHVRAPSPNGPLPARGLNEKDEMDELDELDEEDDDFVQKWRQSRLKELQNRPRDSTVSLNGQNRRAFGGLTTVDGEGYLDAVDNSGLDTVVVVYIYDDMSQVSDLFEDCIRTLSGKHQSTRFVKLHYEDAQMEPAGVPAMIAYRGGDKFAALVPIINELPDDADLSALTLEMVMKRHGILE